MGLPRATGAHDVRGKRNKPRPQPPPSQSPERTRCVHLLCLWRRCFSKRKRRPRMPRAPQFSDRFPEIAGPRRLFLPPAFWTCIPKTSHRNREEPAREPPLLLFCERVIGRTSRSCTRKRPLPSGTPVELNPCGRCSAGRPVGRVPLRHSSLPLDRGVRIDARATARRLQSRMRAAGTASWPRGLADLGGGRDPGVAALRSHRVGTARPRPRLC